MPEDRKLHILMLEDNPADTVLNAEQLRDAGLSFEYHRVENEQDYLRELAEFRPDIILADYRLPLFDGLAALRIARERYPFIPFILVTGVLEEEAAAELFRTGATDYIRKGKTARLGTAVKNALTLKAAQEEKARAEEELKRSYHELERRVEERTRQLARANESLKESARRFQQLFRSSISGVAIADFKGTVFEANDYYLNILEYSREDFEKHRIRWEEMTPPEYLHLDYGAVEELKERGVCTPYEKEYITKSGRRKWVNISDIILPGDEPRIIAFVVDITERKKAEEEVHRREEEFRTLAENAPVGIMRLDTRNTFLYVNREAEHIMLSARERIIGRQVGMFDMPEEAQKVFRKNAQRAIETLQPADMEFFLPRGELLNYYQVRFVPETSGGRSQTVLAIFSDITGLKETEERLRQAGSIAEARAREAEESRSILEAIMEYIPEGLLIADAETGEVRSVSRYIAEFAGTDRERMRGITLDEYRELLRIHNVTGDLMRPAEMPIGRSLSLGEIVIDEEYILKKKSGEAVNVLINTVPIRDKQGKITGAVASWRDITERKKTEETLRRNEYELRTLVDNSPDLIFRLNRQLQYVYANPAYERLTGVSREKFTGKTNSQLGMPQQMVDFWQSTAQGVLENGQERSVEFDITSFFGRRYFFARIIPEFEKSGLVETVLVIARDITERRKAEEQIRYISFHDEVTGLFNRAFFEEEIRRVDAERELPISIIMGDVNNLKLTNDVFGHDEGDKLLKAIADSLRRACRQSDIAARWGGDEFAVILPKTDPATAGEIRARIDQIAAGSEGTVLRPSIALGIAAKEQRDQNIYQVIRQAEERMYEHKLSCSKENQEMIFSCLLERTKERMREYASHVERSCVMADRFAQELELSEEQAKDLRLLVDLHDIGDAVIPPEILTKPGRLNGEEWDIVKKHSEAGFRIVKTYADTARISDEILSHGEHWDGAGYPRGLKGKEIPYLSRIFLIVDAFDVMTHPRPYARTFSREEAIEELRRGAGKQFDPELVDVFIKMLSGAAKEKAPV